MMVVLFIWSRDAIKRIEDGVRDLAPASANMQVVSVILDACRNLCDMLRPFQFNNGRSES
jgi:plasmid stabilization system protein ParE